MTLENANRIFIETTNVCKIQLDRYNLHKELFKNSIAFLKNIVLPLSIKKEIDTKYFILKNPNIVISESDNIIILERSLSLTVFYLKTVERYGIETNILIIFEIVCPYSDDIYQFEKINTFINCCSSIKNDISIDIANKYNTNYDNKLCSVNVLLKTDEPYNIQIKDGFEYAIHDLFSIVKYI